jgi:hypothetical protein
MGCTQGIVVADDLEELQYGNIGGEEGYSLLEGSFGSNTSTSDVPPDCTMVSKRSTAYERQALDTMTVNRRCAMAA